MINQELQDYIQQQKTAGVQDEDIKKKLIENGWKEEDIRDAFPKPIYESEKIPTDIQPVKTEVFTVNKSKTSKSILIIAATILLICIIFYGLWIIYQRFSQKLSNNVINPIATPTTDIVQKNQKYNNATYGFSIQYPVGWQAQENSTSGVIVNLINLSPDADNGNRFEANINVVSESAGNLTLQDYVSSSKKVLNDSFTNYKEIKESNITVNGKEATLIEANYMMKNFNLHNMQMFIVNGGKAFVITATALDSVWNKYKDALNSDILSFTLK